MAAPNTEPAEALAGDGPSPASGTGTTSDTGLAAGGEQPPAAQGSGQPVEARPDEAGAQPDPSSARESDAEREEELDSRSKEAAVVVVSESSDGEAGEGEESGSESDEEGEAEGVGGGGGEEAATASEDWRQSLAQEARQSAMERLKEAFHKSGKPELWDGLWDAEVRIGDKKRGRASRRTIFSHPEVTKGVSEWGRRCPDDVLRILGILPQRSKRQRADMEAEAEAISGGLGASGAKRLVRPPMPYIAEDDTPQHLHARLPGTSSAWLNAPHKGPYSSGRRTERFRKTKPLAQLQAAPEGTLHRANRFESYWFGESVAVPDGGSFIACTLTDSRGRQKLVAYGYDRSGSGHYSYTHMPGMEDFGGPLQATSQREVKDWLGQLGVVVREPPGDDALEIDYQKLKPLPSFRRRQSGGPQHTKLAASALARMCDSGGEGVSGPSRRHGRPESSAHTDGAAAESDTDGSDGGGAGPSPVAAAGPSGARTGRGQPAQPPSKRGAVSRSTAQTKAEKRSAVNGGDNLPDLLKRVREGQVALDLSEDLMFRCKQARDAAQKAYDAATAMHCKLHKDQRSLQADLDAIK